MTWGVRSLEVRLGGRPVLTGVDLVAEPGAVVAVAGGDGAGKTTLLRVLAGALEPKGGAVSRPPPRRIGYLPASSGTYPDLTVDENLAFVARTYGTRLGDPAVTPMLERTGLADARDRLGGRLSGGMRQKLGFLMATLHRPDLLVLDEPTTGVDPASRTDLFRLLGRAAAEGAAVVLSTNYLDEAERADTVLILEEGRPLLGGAVQDVVSSVPGAVLRASARPETEARWRRGGGWRWWSPHGSAPPGSERIEPDLQDAVTVAALASRERAP